MVADLQHFWGAWVARWGLCLLLLANVLTGAPRPKGGEGKRGVVQRNRGRGKSLEGTRGGASPSRDFSISLPPISQTDRHRRYPVLFLLHGFTDSDDKWFGAQPHF